MLQMKYKIFMRLCVYVLVCCSIITHMILLIIIQWSWFCIHWSLWGKVSMGISWCFLNCSLIFIIDCNNDHGDHGDDCDGKKESHTVMMIMISIGVIMVMIMIVKCGINDIDDNILMMMMIVLIRCVCVCVCVCICKCVDVCVFVCV